MLLTLLMTGFVSSHVLAQDNADDSGKAESIEDGQVIDSGEARDIKKMVDTLNTDITELKFLTTSIENAESPERDVLHFRKDERSFRLLDDFDTLTNEIFNLPDGSPQKEEWTKKLADLGKGAGEAIFNRIHEIKDRIDLANKALESLGGGEQIVAQAFIHSLETIRVKYYQALVEHLESRKSLGLSSEKLRERLSPKLYLYAETLAGRIELNGAAFAEAELRAQQEPDNAEIITVLTTLDARRTLNLNRLESITQVLDSMDLDSSAYKTILLTQSGNLSVSIFSPKVLSSVFSDSWNKLKDAIEDNAPEFLIRLILFLGILFLFRLLARITTRMVRAASERSSVDMSELLKNILVSTSSGAVMAIGVLVALSQIGISLAPMLAGLGVAGFIVGFALQDTLGNFAAGTMILIYRPFDVDDFVEVTGASGLVKKMNLVSTTITTFDNQTLVVPNSKIWGDVIKNVTAQTERRVDLEFGIGYDDDIEHAERVLHEIVTSHEKVLKDPEHTIKLHTLADSSVNFIVRPWTKTDDYWDVYWDLTREVKLRFDKEGISIPYPQRDVHLYPEKES
jgi:small conductance mechanosensitive channel